MSNDVSGTNVDVKRMREFADHSRDNIDARQHRRRPGGRHEQSRTDGPIRDFTRFGRPVGSLARFYAVFAAAALIIGTVWIAGFVLDGRRATIVNDAGQLVAGLAAVVCCALTSRRTTGAERSWRLLL